MRTLLLVMYVLLLFTKLFYVVFSDVKTDLLHQIKFPPCKSCKVYIESFMKGMEKTKKGKFEGGDAAWEEQKQGSYAKSEVRLVEIQEHVCSDIEEGKDQCYKMNEDHDSIIEDWWFNLQDFEPDLFKYFCIDTIKQCCPDFHFGPNCTPCPGYPDGVCSGNGKCKGAGTRKGNGKCSCNEDYSGENCNNCAQGYYEAYRDDKKFLCSKCHTSCQGTCNKAGPTGCESCKGGWIMDKEKGCLDVNECAVAKSICSPLQFCVNTEGSYNCLDCDRSCAGCTGDGPDMCIRCANGYSFINNICIDSDQESRKQHIFITRYLTYLGLCVATCIIFQRNVALSAVIGLAVAVYITVSEYMLNTPPIANTTNIIQRLHNEN